MKRVYLLIILLAFITSLNAKSAREYITFEEKTFWDWNSPQCYGNDSSLANTKIIVQLPNDYFGKYSTTYYDNLDSQSKYYNTKSYQGISCGTSIVYYPSIGSTYYVYYPSDSNDPDLIPNVNAVYQKHKVVRIETVTPCQTEPSSNSVSGLDYQSIVSDDSTCNSIYSDNGDGLGYLYANPNLDKSCDGFCYFNKPDTTNPTDPDPTNPTDPTEPTTPTDKNNDVTILIPYLDEVEQKNQTIIDTLEKINTTLISNKESEEENNNKEEFTNIGEGFISDSSNLDADLSSELSDFDSDIRGKLDDSFSTYSNVFGLSGYGSAPAPIDFNLLGRSYRVFDISYINSYVDTIRNIFAISAYFLGLFLVFRGN